MEPGYTCSLPKETLAYNLAYHIKSAKTAEELYARIKSVLDSFELKKDTNK